MLNEKKIVASYKSIMASGKSKADRAAALKAVPGLDQLTDRFAYIADGRRNVAKIAATLMSEVEYINAVHLIAVNIEKHNEKEARRVLYKLSDKHVTDFIGLTLDDVDSALGCGNYKRALSILGEIGGAGGLKINASVEALASEFK